MQMMWHVLFVFLMLIGAFRLYDGKRKLQAETTLVDKYNQIPDKDVRAHYKLLNFLNQKFGKFYIYYGFLLIATSVFNSIAMIFQKSLDFSLIPVYSWFFGIVVGFFIIGDRNRKFNIQSSIRLPARIKTSFDFLTEMLFLYNAYAQHHFSPQKEWVEKAQQTADLSEKIRLVQEAKDLPIPINWYIKSVFFHIIGAVIYYFSVIAIVVYITTMQILNFWI